MKYQQAKDIAIRVLKELQPFCIEADIAGSIRREKPDVKDIEICVLPRTIEAKDLFGQVLGTERLPNFISAVKGLGLILKGKPADGRYIQISLPEEINLDLFILQETDYFRQLCVRTGSADYSHKIIAAAWLKIGWGGTKDGLRLQSESYQKLIGKYNDGRDKFEWICVSKNPTLPPVWKNEYEFYQFLNLEWKIPSQRNV